MPHWWGGLVRQAQVHNVGRGQTNLVFLGASMETLRASCSAEGRAGNRDRRKLLVRFFSCACSIDFAVTIGRIKADDEPTAGPSW